MALNSLSFKKVPDSIESLSRGKKARKTTNYSFPSSPSLIMHP